MVARTQSKCTLPSGSLWNPSLAIARRRGRSKLSIPLCDQPTIAPRIGCADDAHGARRVDHQDALGVEAGHIEIPGRVERQTVRTVRRRINGRSTNAIEARSEEHTSALQSP